MSPKPTKTIVIQTDLTSPTSQQPATDNTSEDLYELLCDAPDNYFTTQLTHPKTDLISEIHPKTPTKHHVTIQTSCNDQKQPLLNEDLTEHIQFDKERNIISPNFNLLNIEAKTPHVLHSDGLRKTHP